VTPLLRGLLAGAARAYCAATALRREVYRREILKPRSAPVPVISIGALTAGGAGKTPVARFIARWLLDDGLRVALVCGGYRGARRLAVTRLDADRAASPQAVERYGDEAVMLARSEQLRDALVICGRDRVAAARLAARQGAQVVVLDDGFQHLRLHRDLDVVLQGAGPARGVAGLVREDTSALAAADLIWSHHRDGSQGTGRCAAVVSRYVPRWLITTAGRTVGDAAELRGRRVFLMAGVADPAAFRALVSATGAEVTGELWVGDHRRFTPQQLHAAARAGAELILCTEKDAARMGSTQGELTALTVEVELLSGSVALQRALKAAVGARSGGAAC